MFLQTTDSIMDTPILLYEGQAYRRPLGQAKGPALSLFCRPVEESLARSLDSACHEKPSPRQKLSVA